MWQRDELAEQLAAARREAADAQAAAFESLQGERDRLVRTVDKLCGELEAACQVRDATTELSEEMTEEARSAQGSFACKDLLLFPLIRWVFWAWRV